MQVMTVCPDCPPRPAPAKRDRGPEPERQSAGARHRRSVGPHHGHPRRPTIDHRGHRGASGSLLRQPPAALARSPGPVRHRADRAATRQRGRPAGATPEIAGVKLRTAASPLVHSTWSARARSSLRIRRAGPTWAAAVTATISSRTPVHTTGSASARPGAACQARRVRTKASTAPTPVPTAATLAPVASTRRSRVPDPAPSADRIANSRVRRRTR